MLVARTAWLKEVSPIHLVGSEWSATSNRSVDLQSFWPSLEHWTWGTFWDDGRERDQIKGDTAYRLG